MADEDNYAVGQKLYLRGTSKWYGEQEYEAHVVDIGTGEHAGTIKVQYDDGGYKRFPLEGFSDLVVEEAHDVIEFGSKDYEWADDQYNPARELDTELIDLKDAIDTAVENKDFLKAKDLKARLLERKSEQRAIDQEHRNLKSAVRREDFGTANEIQSKIDAMKAQKTQAVQADKGGQPPPALGEILQKAKDRAFRGGLAGMGAMVFQVCSFMWLRTTMNYQYRYGGNGINAIKVLYKEGGIPRFYRGIAPALVTGPLSRFGDTACNTGALALLDGLDSTRNLPVGVKTGFASASAACFRVFITPIDTLKTTMQVEGKEGVNKLRAKIGRGGPLVMYHGAVGNMSATFAGHYPWFFTYNTLQEKIPTPVDTLPKLGRNAFIGFCSSVVSDCVSNSIRVLKVYRQTNEKAVPYMQAAREIIAKDGLRGLFLRGLETRIFTNGAQGIVFSVLWKYFDEALSKK
jgi:hypothetical protein